MNLKSALSATLRRARALMAGFLAMIGTLAHPVFGEETDALDALIADSNGPKHLTIHGYADLLVAGDSRDEGRSFVQNELSIFLRATTRDEKWTAFTEVEFDHIEGDEYLTDRGGKAFELEMETGWVEHRHSDRFRLRAGKLLLPQYWQANHYPNLTMSTLAPLMSGNVFPKYIVALQTSGDWWTANERGIGYTLFLGRSAKTALVELDQNDNLAGGGRLTFRLAGKNKPARLDTFDVSFSALASENAQNQDELILGADIQIRLSRLELLAEFAQGSLVRFDESLRSRFPQDKGDTVGLYVQAAYRLSPKWHAYYRYDYLDLNDGSPTPRDETRHTLGANFRPRPFVSLKLEVFRSEPESPRDPYDGVSGSVVFNF